MATLKSIAPFGLQPLGPSFIRTYKEAATQSFKAGDLVTLSSGKVAIAKAAGNNLASGDKVLGMALMDASGTTDTDIKVLIFTESTELVLPVYHATAASAITATASNGTAFELRNQTGGIWCVDIGSTSNPKVTQVSIHPEYPIGEQYGWIVVRFLKAQLVFG